MDRSLGECGIIVMRDGRADVHAGLNVTDGRRGFLDFGDALLTTNSYVFSPASGLRTGLLNELTGSRVGVLRGSLEETVLRQG